MNGERGNRRLAARGDLRSREWRRQETGHNRVLRDSERAANLRSSAFICGVVLFLALLILPLGNAWAYPEFQTAIEQSSARNVNCAMCHTHPDGPEGLKPGQIGSLAPDQLEALGRARAAFEPGQEVDSPILNEFGDSIIRQLGKQKFLQVRQVPDRLGSLLNAEQDLDRDGIPDVEELAAGTLATDPNHGDPWRLFQVNFTRRWFDLLMISLATGAGLYGLHHLLLGFEQLGRAAREDGESV